MTKQQCRETKDYEKTMNKIKNYPKGFVFKMRYSDLNISKPMMNGLKLILNDAVSNGLLESLEIGYAVNGDLCEETFRRL